MKKLTLFIFTTLTITVFYPLLWSGAGVYAQNYKWALGFGGPNNHSHSTSIATDLQGNVYVAGFFGDNIDFDPGIGTATLTAVFQNIFIAKYDSTGAYKWAFSIGQYGGNATPSLAVNNTGLYITGEMIGTVDFDPSAAVANLTANGADIFLAKYDFNGNYMWAKNMGGNAIDVAKAVAVDNLGNSYITGYFSDSVDFDPGAGVALLVSGSLQDILFAKYDSTGGYVWAHSIGSNTSSGSGQKVILSDSNNHIYISGYFGGSPDFDPSPSVAVVTSVNIDDFLAKYDTSGNFIWAGAISSSFTGGNLISEIQVYTNPNFSTEYLIVTGSFRNITDFDLTTGINNFSSAGTSQDLYIAKYDQSGNFISLRTLTAGTSIGPRGISFQIDTVGSIYLTGTYYGTTDFDPDANLVNLTSNGNSDIFFAKYDSSGAYLWVKGIGGTYIDEPSKIALDNANNQYLTGFFTGSMDANPDMGSALLSPSQSENFLIGKYIELPTSILNSHALNYENIITYPNPSKDFVFFSESFNQEKLTVKVSNTLGQPVIETVTSSNKININSLARGVYLLKIMVKNKSYYGKFIKQ